MAKCKYPNEVCANMTMLRGVAYCDSTPCSLKDELPKRTNTDRIRSMSDEELAEFLCGICSEYEDCCFNCVANDYCKYGHTGYIDWLQSESEE